MAIKEHFSQDEWTKILEGPMLAGMAISAAEPSGLWGSLKEAFASGSALVAAKTDPDSNELVKAVVADYEASETRSQVQEALRATLAEAKPDEVVARALEELKRISTVLDEKAPADATAFKTWLSGIAEKVAEASKEGGFLGFGSVQVSDAEKATLDDIVETLALRRRSG